MNKVEVKDGEDLKHRHILEREGWEFRAFSYAIVVIDCEKLIGS